VAGVEEPKAPRISIHRGFALNQEFLWKRLGIGLADITTKALVDSHRPDVHVFESFGDHVPGAGKNPGLL
jgi:hypothetical protein